jgi:hypothetical protein
MTLLIREDPADEQSDVAFQFEFELEADSVVGSVVRWEITEARFIEYDNGFILHRWTVEFPAVDSSSGFWEVTHTDTENPETQEFDTLPTLVGTAESDIRGADLDYEISAGSLTQAEEAMYGGDVAGMTYRLIKEDEPEPVREGEDEPEESDVPVLPSD